MIDYCIINRIWVTLCLAKKPQTNNKQNLRQNPPGAALARRGALRHWLEYTESYIEYRIQPPHSLRSTQLYSTHYSDADSTAVVLYGMAYCGMMCNKKTRNALMGLIVR